MSVPPVLSLSMPSKPGTETATPRSSIPELDQGDTSSAEKRYTDRLQNLLQQLQEARASASREQRSVGLGDEEVPSGDTQVAVGTFNNKAGSTPIRFRAAQGTAVGVRAMPSKAETGEHRAVPTTEDPDLHISDEEIAALFDDLGGENLRNTSLHPDDQSYAPTGIVTPSPTESRPTRFGTAERAAIQKGLERILSGESTGPTDLRAGTSPILAAPAPEVRLMSLGGGQTEDEESWEPVDMSDEEDEPDFAIDIQEGEEDPPTREMSREEIKRAVRESQADLAAIPAPAQETVRAFAAPRRSTIIPSLAPEALEASRRSISQIYYLKGLKEVAKEAAQTDNESPNELIERILEERGEQLRLAHLTATDVRKAVRDGWKEAGKEVVLEQPQQTSSASPKAISKNTRTPENKQSHTSLLVTSNKALRDLQKHVNDPLLQSLAANRGIDLNAPSWEAMTQKNTSWVGRLGNWFLGRKPSVEQIQNTRNAVLELLAAYNPDNREKEWSTTTNTPKRRGRPPKNTT